MGFFSGTMSFGRYAVLGPSPEAVDEALLEKFAGQKVDEEIPADDVQTGWCGGAHLLDATFTYEHNVVADCLHVGMRVDTNKVPGDLRRAYVAIEEGPNPVGKGDRQAARDAADRKLDDEKRSGRFRRSKMSPVLWDVAGGIVYGPAAASGTGGAGEQLFELFDRTTGLSLLPLTSGNLASRRLESQGRRRDFEDLRPTAFVASPGGEGQGADYPWASKLAGGKNFLGNEFLLWLWAGSEAGGDKAVYVEKMLDLDCCFGITGRDTIRGDGPHLTPEARHALRTGKVPRKMGLVLEGEGPYGLTLSGETLAVLGLSVPEDDKADDPRVVIEARVGGLVDFCRTLDGLFDAFLKVRASGGWPAETARLRDWITRATQRAAA